MNQLFATELIDQSSKTGKVKKEKEETRKSNAGPRKVSWYLYKIV